ncbi:hypothetical protein [Lysinibacillus irui]|uniref:Uncharacterized protein n=1 Tax=Lysinibacillus irui TaxID=2998077 RepID=A0AAJ5RQW8_9BACI|nr:hypothetical protein [Lysinibacillus irui]WDV09381.1 hypothetical protein OU989_22960 [Lysinibacillus irui]
MREMRFLYVILAIMVIPVLYVVVLSFQDSQIIEGTIQQKSFQEKKCTQEPTFDPAFNMVMLKENCEGPNWTIRINNKQYDVTEHLYNKLEINSSYSFSYHPLKGMSLLEVRNHATSNN